MLNRRRRSTLGVRGEKSRKVVNGLRGEEEDLGGWERLLQGEAPPKEGQGMDQGRVAQHAGRGMYAHSLRL